jgi:hypothetical protein
MGAHDMGAAMQPANSYSTRFEWQTSANRAVWLITSALQPCQLATHACNHGKVIQEILMHSPLKLYAHPIWSAPQAIVEKDTIHVLAFATYLHSPLSTTPQHRHRITSEFTSVHACLAPACAAQVTAGC